MEWSDQLKRKMAEDRRLQPGSVLGVVAWVIIIAVLLLMFFGSPVEAEGGQSNAAANAQMKQLMRDIARSEQRQAVALERIAAEMRRCARNDKEEKNSKEKDEE